MTIALDATVLVNFGRVSAIYLLPRATSDDLIVLDEVAAELLQPETAVRQFNDARATGSIRRHSLTSEEEFSWLANIRERFPSLGSGEAATLAACLANDWVFASDDRQARQLAASLRASPDLRVSGTLGLLIGAVERDVIDQTEGQSLLERMIEEGYRSPITRLPDSASSDQTTTSVPATPAK